MVQTFTDLLRDRSEVGKGVVGYATWMYAETLIQIWKINLVSLAMKIKRLTGTNFTANTSHRTGIVTAVCTAFLLAWMSTAVGIIGPTNNPANELYAGVLVVAMIGALLSLHTRRDLAIAAWVTAVAQFLVSIIVLL
ncbi:MAG TPA: hypothetical protein VEF04_22180, partial [Blastocatellia bacterium]|nr:hypothetical protein [Blastocatellia bacterium]